MPRLAFAKPIRKKPARRKRQQKKERAARRRKLEAREREAKAAARMRDQRCRFPLCGCHGGGWPLEVSHHKHKGMGGDPTGERSTTAGLVLLCRHRHQEGRISIHAKTLRPVFLTADGYDGPVAWEIDQDKLPFMEGSGPSRWLRVFQEDAVGHGRPTSAYAELVLAELSAMEV